MYMYVAFCHVVNVLDAKLCVTKTEEPIELPLEGTGQTHVGRAKE